MRNDIDSRAQNDMAELAEGVLTQDIAYSVNVVSAGWDDHLEELAALLGSRFRIPTAAVMSALQAGEVTVVAAVDLHTASSVIEALANLSIVATARPAVAIQPPAEQTLLVGWSQVAGPITEQPFGRTMQGSPSQLVNQLDQGDLAAVFRPQVSNPHARHDSEVPSPWASALAPGLGLPAGVTRPSPARERAALLRGEAAAVHPPPAGNLHAPVAMAEGRGISAITRISSVNDELEQTLILADVSAQAVAILQESHPFTDVNAGEAANVGAWGAVLGKGVEAQLAAVVSAATPAPAAAEHVLRPPAEPPIFAAMDEQREAAAPPRREAPKAFVRLHAPDDAVATPAVAPTSAAASKGNIPLRAALFSLLAPGAGQAYNNQQGRAVTFALAGVLIVPWLVSIRDAWNDAARSHRTPGPTTPNVKAAATVAFTFWLLAGLFGTFIWSIDLATTDTTSSVVAPPMNEPVQVPLVASPAQQSAMVRESDREASAEPAADRAELRERIAGLVARAQLACNSGEYVDCRQLAEQALALDETDPGAHRVHVVAIEGISGFQERSEAAGSNGMVNGSPQVPRPAVHPRDAVPAPAPPSTPPSATPALQVSP
ncbi:MAG: hypothetical protein KGO50_07890 [Myxococcales bacterium]|nr:hypothetical protein [Myxococcales bacterium]